MNEANESKFATRKWNNIDGNSKANYGVGSQVMNNAEVLKPNFCGYNNTYILVKGDITIVGDQAIQLAFTNCAPFTKCIAKNGGTIKDDAEDLDIVMPMYNLIGYNSNYSETTGSLWFYSKDEATDFNAYIANTNNLKSFT